MKKIAQDTQRKLIFLLLFIVLSIPAIIPLSIPVNLTKQTLDAYNTIESMPNGSTALLDWDFSVMSYPEVYPQAYAFLKHAISKHFKFVIITFVSADAVIYAKQALADVDLTGYTYGVDYVQLGYYPGGVTPLTAFAQDIHKLVKTDVYGTPIDGMPLMQRLKTARDFNIWLIGNYGPTFFPGAIVSPYNAIMVSGSDSSQYTGMLPYYMSGQLKGLLNGARGAMEYEQLLGYLGVGTRITNAQSFSHFFIISAIILGNIIFWSNKRAGKK